MVDGDGKFHDLDSSNYEKNSRESEPFLTPDDQLVDRLEKEIKVENAIEDYPEFIDDLSTINAKLKTQTLKSEDEIDIVATQIILLILFLKKVPLISKQALNKIQF
ncbi:hypothetical protein JTB14_013803 [Gonioctena quinquepunctata]|nr:hypothetical protein JTB14_013803 [Gonioctena quinquepunctata]